VTREIRPKGHSLTDPPRCYGPGHRTHLGCLIADGICICDGKQPEVPSKSKPAGASRHAAGDRMHPADAKRCPSKQAVRQNSLWEERLTVLQDAPSCPRFFLPGGRSVMGPGGLKSEASEGPSDPSLMCKVMWATATVSPVFEPLRSRDIPFIAVIRRFRRARTATAEYPPYTIFRLHCASSALHDTVLLVQRYRPLPVRISRQASFGTRRL